MSNTGPKKNCSDGNGGCGQLCFDGDGGLTCSCLPGYIMIGDGRTCKGDFKTIMMLSLQIVATAYNSFQYRY